MSAAATMRLDLGSDVGIRRQWFAEDSFAHPAKLHLGLLQWIIDRYTQPGDTICDPMAGIGSILLAATQQRGVIAREIEPKWLELLHRNAALVYERAGLFAAPISAAQGDAREPWGATADHVIFSPPYGCETNNRAWRKSGLDKLDQVAAVSKRWRYLAAQSKQSGAWGGLMFDYGQHPAQIGHLRNHAYWQAMRVIYANAYAALRNGYLVLIIKDHIKAGQRICVADETVALCESLGFGLAEHHARHVHPLSLWQRRRKERGEPIVEDEDVLVFRRAA